MVPSSETEIRWPPFSRLLADIFTPDDYDTYFLLVLYAMKSCEIGLLWWESISTTGNILSSSS